MLFDGTLDPAGGLRLRDAVTCPVPARSAADRTCQAPPVCQLHQIRKLSVRSAVAVGVPVRASGESGSKARATTRPAGPRRMPSVGEP